MWPIIGGARQAWLVYSAEKPAIHHRVPSGLDYALRFGVPALVAVACAWVAVWVIGRASFALVPMAISLLVTALLTPAVRWLDQKTPLNRYLSGALLLLALLGSVFTLVWAATRVMVSQMGSITEMGRRLINEGAAWLREGPLKMDSAELQQATDQAQEWLSGHSGSLVQSAMTFGSSLSEISAMTLLVLVSAFFFLGDGPAMWRAVMWLVPPSSRRRQFDGSRRGWRSLELYARTAVAVAAIDAIFIGLGAWLLKVPFPIPVAILVFVSAFIPFIGAIASGAVAIALALFAQGPMTALLMLLVVLAVQQLEGNVLQPLLMGKTVSLHPYAVIVGVSLAGYLWGLVGALLAVPAMAFVMAWLRYLNDDDRYPQLGSESPTGHEDGQDDEQSPETAEEAKVAARPIEPDPVGARSVERD